MSFLSGCYVCALHILFLHHHARLQRCNGAAVHNDVYYSSSSLNKASSALLAFKAGITSDPGSLLASWTSGSNPCDQSRPWEGVACDAAGGRNNVAALRLAGRGLSGAMISAAALATLCEEGLSVLNLANNSLSGSLPPSLGANCSSLRRLDLGSNLLSGPLPPSAFSNLPSLRFLDLSHNNFSGPLPPQIWHLPALRTLYLLSPAGDQNPPMQASHVPEVVPFCATLTHLWLEAVSIITSGNQLMASLSQCKRLQELVLNETGLAGTIPEDFWQLPSLTTLALITSSPGDPQLAATSLPTSMASCPSLVILKLENVMLAGATLPRSLGDCKKLQELTFYQTGVQGLLPQSVWELPALLELTLFEPHLMSEAPLPQHLPSCGTIEAIQIQGVIITGQIPPSIGDCSGLQWLTLVEVGLTGPLPESLGTLANLEVLQLDGNSLTGPLPSSLSQCSQLLLIRLGGNPIMGTIPKEFGKLSRLQYLSLYGCNLTGPVPSELGNCSELQWLDLGWNNISSGMPQSFANLHNLQTLSWNGNPLPGGVLPEFVTANLSLLVELDLTRCSLAQFPLRLGDLSWLQTLNLDTNRLEGPIPSSFMDQLGRLSQLQHLNLDTNRLELGASLINQLGRLPAQLQYLSLRGNRIEGPLPRLMDQLGRLSQLQHLSLGVNRIEGPISSLMKLSRLSQLTFLNLGTNKLSGSLSEELIHALSNCTQLAQFYMDNNHLSGSLPHNLGDMQSLQVLYINDNMFSGSIPPSIGNLSLMNDLDMGNNRLQGQIPSSLGRLVGLNANLILSNNTLTSSIPKELGSLSQLKVLDLSKNNLNGDVPWAALRNCTSLERLRLHENSLAGALDEMELWKMSSLTTFTAQRNQLHGKITSNLTRSSSLVLVDLGTNNLSRDLPSEKVSQGLEKLRVLILSNNKFGGGIPNWIWELPSLRVLELSNSSLRGAMPTSMAHLEYFKRNGNQLINGSMTLYEDVPLPNHETPQIISYLLNTRIVLDISHNSIHGRIPYSIGELVGLTWLDLSHNLLIGGIPPSLGSITYLDVLDLSSNSLSGTIPSELGLLTFLGRLNLSNNDLYGPIPITINTHFGPSSFQGNAGLCGYPLSNLCNTTNTTIGNTTNLDDTMPSSWFDDKFSLGGTRVKGPIECHLIVSYSSFFLQESYLKIF